MMKKTLRRWQVLPCAALALALVVAGCSDNGDDDSSGGGADVSVLGKANTATGTPVEIFFPTTGSKAATYTHETEVAKRPWPTLTSISVASTVTPTPLPSARTRCQPPRPANAPTRPAVRRR